MTANFAFKCFNNCHASAAGIGKDKWVKAEFV